MARFVLSGKSNSGKTFALSICVFLVVLMLFLSGISSMSAGSVARQKEALSDALQRDIVYCYATTGAYPESLDSIKEMYGLTYDEDLFYVDYHTIGSNIYPQCTIIERED